MCACIQAYIRRLERENSSLKATVDDSKLALAHELGVSMRKCFVLQEKVKQLVAANTALQAIVGLKKNCEEVNARVRL